MNRQALGLARNADQELRSRTWPVGSDYAGRILSALEAAARVADHVFSTLVADQAPAWGRRVFLLDRTTLSLTDHPELVERFPPAEHQHGHFRVLILRLLDFFTRQAVKMAAGET
jgi:hypothetical protein